MLFLFMFAVTSCDDYLDVEPMAQYEADQLFSNSKGFESALIGCYIGLTQPSSYGMNLTYGGSDMLADYYDIPSSHQYRPFLEYNYETSLFKDFTNNTYLGVYNVIANLNVILDRLEDEDINDWEPVNYNLVKGEALAMRAYLHFDILRYFAPRYQDDKDFKKIAFATEATTNIIPSQTTEYIVNHIIQDLEAAKLLLVDVDECLTENFRNWIYKFNQPSNLDYFTSTRGFRLNYLAVTALLARIHIYRGMDEDYSKALQYASIIINEDGDIDEQIPDEDPSSLKSQLEDEHLSLLPWVKEADISASLEKRDLIYMPEVIFALYDIGIVDRFMGLNLSLKEESIFPSANDFRRTFGIIEEDNIKVSVKYAKLNNDHQGKIPMIRKTEMYLYAAEIVFDTDKKKASKYLQAIRRYRGINEPINYEVTKPEWLELVREEARAEFVGEGQMWHFYKRHNVAIPESPFFTSDKYVLPIPVTELQYGERN